MDRLEIVGPDGEVLFYNLDPVKGFTNIGSDPENDIVLADPRVAPFQATLMHQQKPYRLLVLSDEGDIFIGEHLLPLYQPTPLQHRSRLEMGDYILFFLEQQGGDGVTAARPPLPTSLAGQAPAQLPSPPAPRSSGGRPPVQVPLPARLPSGREGPAANQGAQPTSVGGPPPAGIRPAPVPRPATRPEQIVSPSLAQPLAPQAGISPTRPGPSGFTGGALTPRAVSRQGQPVADEEDDFIVTELAASEQTVNVLEKAIYQLTIVNGGDLVASFRVDVEGLPSDWVEIMPDEVNLFEGNRAVVTVAITPARQPGSYAGPHHFALVVTSFNYPGRYARRGATVVVNPYYEFAVSEIVPRQQSISWFQRNARATITISNNSNTHAVFQVDGRDDERRCSFEFQVPGEGARLANQAEFYIPPDETTTLPLVITPHTRQLVALHKRTYNYTLTTTMPEGGLLPRSMLGQLKTGPLIGPILLLLLSLLLLLLIVFIFKPRITAFNIDGSLSKVITAGDSVTLYWQASPFTRLLIPELSTDPLDSNVGNMTLVPTASASYELKGDNWLSRLSPQWLGTDPRTVSVIVTPVPPVIKLFGGDKQNIVTGDKVLLSWQVEGADTVNLINRADSTPKEVSNPNGSLDTGPLDQETVYYLEAKNAYIATPIRSAPFTIRVATPTPTPQPTPAILKFFANPAVIVAGASSVLEWQVSGTDQVSVLPIGSGLPAAQSVSVSPAQTTNYVLNAANGPAAAKPQSLTIFVTPAPTATPPPTAPQIKFFTADPDSLILLKGTNDQVELKWSVVGQTTSIEISGPSLNNPVIGLNPDGTINLTVDEPTIFVLTAANGDAKVSANVEITVDEPTPTPTPVPTGTPAPPTATPIPTAVISQFEIVSPGSPKVVDQGGTNPRKYEVQENTSVTFKWQVNNANKVTFAPDSGSSKEVGNIAQTVEIITVPSAGQVRTYLLIAENSINERTQASIEVTVVDPPPPNPPYSVTGVENIAANQNELAWQWTADANRDTIIGFRVYRASVPGGSYGVVADESALGTAARAYVDAVSPTCGLGYYVVAVYLDVLGNKQESPASLNSWYSSACP